MSEDFYEVLGVSRDADEDEIQQAFRKKAAKYHPDVSDDDDAEEKFRKAKKAKEVLTDEEKRQAYDQMGHERFEQAEKHGGFEDIFEQFFGGGRGGRGGGGNRPQAGRDIRTGMEITLSEAYEGVSKEFTIERPEECPDCGGTGHPESADVETCPECNGQGQVTQVQQTPLGRVQQTQTCRRCSGEGEIYSESCGTCAGDGVVRQEATLQVDVPAGIRSGQSLRMEREGAPGENGGPKGDLLIEVDVADHPEFDRDGDDLQHRHAISFPQATFGATVEIPTLDGTVELDVPAGTQSGERFRLRGKGMPRLRGRGEGDLYVTVQVVTPDDLNEEQREALKQFAEAGGEEVDVDRGFFEKLKDTF